MPARPLHTRLGRLLRPSHDVDPPDGQQPLRLKLLSAVPALSVSGVLSAAWATTSLTGVPTGATVSAACLMCGVVLVVGDRRAQTATKAARENIRHELQRQVKAEQANLAEWLQHYQVLVTQGSAAVSRAFEQVHRGEDPVLPIYHEALGDDPFSQLAYEIRQLGVHAVHALHAAAQRSGRPEQRAELADTFVGVAQRQMVLVSRTLEALTALENKIEDPDLLDDVFTIDHLVTLARRAGESLAVLGGATARRATKPLPLSAVLRQAGAEIEQYTRVRVTWPATESWIAGHASLEIIHLLAELIENATKFSRPTEPVIVRTSRVRAGLAVEIEDRGLPMSPAKLATMNLLLTSPDDIDAAEQIRARSIGLYVTALIAQRHGIRVRLQPNLLGGTQAVVVVPEALLTVPESPNDRPYREAATAPAACPTSAARPLPPEIPAPAAQPSNQRSSGTASPPLPQRRRTPLPEAAAPADTTSTSPQPATGGRRPDPTRSPEPAGSASPGFAGGFARGIRQKPSSAAPSSDGDD